MVPLPFGNTHEEIYPDDIGNRNGAFANVGFFSGGRPSIGARFG